MNFLIFWGVSSAICMLVILIWAKGLEAEVRREYEVKEIPKSKFVEKVSGFLPYCIPFLNILIVVVALFMKEQSIQKTVEKFGLIKKE